MFFERQPEREHESRCVVVGSDVLRDDLRDEAIWPWNVLGEGAEGSGDFERAVAVPFIEARVEGINKRVDGVQGVYKEMFAAGLERAMGLV